MQRCVSSFLFTAFQTGATPTPQGAGLMIKAWSAVADRTGA